MNRKTAAKKIVSFPGCHGKSESSLRTRLAKPSPTLCANLPASASAHDYSTITWVVSNSFFIASFALSLSAPNYKNTRIQHRTETHRKSSQASKFKIAVITLYKRFLPLPTSQVLLIGQERKHQLLSNSLISRFSPCANQVSKG